MDFPCNLLYLPISRTFEATEARTLRVVLSGFYDMASVVARTFLEFDDGGLGQAGR